MPTNGKHAVCFVLVDVLDAQGLHDFTKTLKHNLNSANVKLRNSDGLDSMRKPASEQLDHVQGFARKLVRNTNARNLTDSLGHGAAKLVKPIVSAGAKSPLKAVTERLSNT